MVVALSIYTILQLSAIVLSTVHPAIRISLKSQDMDASSQFFMETVVPADTVKSSALQLLNVISERVAVKKPLICTPINVPVPSRAQTFASMTVCTELDVDRKSMLLPHNITPVPIPDTVSLAVNI